MELMIDDLPMQMALEMKDVEVKPIENPNNHLISDADCFRSRHS